eukprot:g6707.t1
MAEVAKAAGGSLFKEKKYTEALQKYEEALALCGVDSDDEPLEEPTEEPAGDADLQVKLLLNVALCQQKLEKWGPAETAASAALAIAPDTPKALFRRGLARAHLGKLDSAKADLVSAAKLEPQSKEIRRELGAVKARLKEQRDAAKAKLAGGKAGGGLLGGVLGYSDEEARLRKGRKPRAKIVQKGKFDANDYSRFDTLIDSDDEDAADEAERKAAEDKRKEEEKKYREAMRRLDAGAPAPAPASESGSANAKVKGTGGGGTVRVDDEKIGDVRGYKLKGDGSKTTFFNHDITPEVAALIGDTTPKPISAAEALRRLDVGAGGAGGAGGGGVGAV